MVVWGFMVNYRKISDIAFWVVLIGFVFYGVYNIETVKRITEPLDACQYCADKMGESWMCSSSNLLSNSKYLFEPNESVKYVSGLNQIEFQNGSSRNN